LVLFALGIRRIRRVAFAWTTVSRSPLPLTAWNKSNRRRAPGVLVYRTRRNAGYSRAASFKPLGSNPSMIVYSSVCAAVMR